MHSFIMVIRLTVLLSLSFLFSACGKREAPSPVINVYAAASLSDVVAEIAEEYAADHEAEVALNFASSGSLARQILATGQVDVYLSANQHWMDEVENAGYVVEGTRVDLIGNRLVVIAAAGSDFSLDDPSRLPELDFQYLVIGDPEHAPAGQYAKRWLEQVEAPGGGSVWEALEGRLSPMPNVRAALMQVRGNGQLVGVVYQTDYESAKDQLRLLYAVPEQTSDPIRYSVAGIAGPNQAGGKDFLAYLESPEAKAIFERHGFIHLSDD